MNQKKNLLLISLLLIALVPFLIICLYALPFADDFCFGWTASEKISFTQKFLNQYLYWNGRYTADVLVNFHPLVIGQLFIYQLILFFSLLAVPVTLFFLLRQFISDWLVAIVTSLLITLFYLNYQPNITEGIYWFIGISNYHLGNLCLLLHFIFLAKSLSVDGKVKVAFQFITCSLLIISVGFNEIDAILIPILYFILLIFHQKPETANRKLFSVFFSISITASAFVFFSPGNFTRANEFPERYNLLHSLLYSSAQTIRFLLKWIFNLSFILLSIVVVSHAEKIKIKTALFDYRYLGYALIFVVFTGSFLPYFATGTLGQHRTINYVFFYFILLWILFLVSVSQKYLLHERLNQAKSELPIFVVVVVSILFMLFSGNSFKILSDWRADNFRKYETAFYERQKAIVQNPQAAIQPLSIIPKTFDVVDVKGDTSWWVDKCMKRFYTKAQVELR